MTQNDKPENAWTDKAGSNWVKLQARTDAQLEPLGTAVIEALAPRPGERVLDIGCGAGQTLLQLSERVGATGGVVGVDVSEPMLTAAREGVRRAGVSNVELVFGNAATEPLPGPFDVVFSRFGVMFFEDSVSAFRHLRASMRSGGRLGFVCWQALEKNPWVALPLRAVQAILPEQPLPALMTPGCPGPFYFSDPELVRRVLGEAGFEQIAIEAREFSVPLGGAKTLDEAVDFTLELGPTSRFVGDAPKDRVPELRAAVRAALAPLETERGIWSEFHAFVVTARSPDSAQ
jgi:SAM-dependent methyltransferase